VHRDVPRAQASGERPPARRSRGHPPGPVPGCSARPRPAPRLPAAGTSFVLVGGVPFGVLVSPDGRRAFVSSTGQQLQVMDAGSRPVLSPAGTLLAPGAHLAGETLTRDGRYLLAASDSGAVVFSTARAGQASPRAMLGSLQGPAGNGRQAGGPLGDGAIEVAVPGGDRLAFVSLDDTAQIAVFNLQRALAHGFGPADYLGSIPAGLAPVGLAVSPDSRWLYATSEVARGGARGGLGSLSVISVPRAATDPAHAVVSTVAAGCQPVRVITSASGQVVWVTARGSNALLGFSAGRLRTDPARALLARVQVGTAPVGLALVDGGRRIVVADSNRFHAQHARSSLAVVSVPAALAGRPALLGLLPAGGFPREMALEPGGRTLLVTCFASGQVEAVDVARLP
jgi:DNA-binding beta-propeller fold protein YncE